MSEFSERLKQFRSSFSLSDRKTQLTLASVTAAIVLLVALIAWPSSDKKGTTTGNGDAAAPAANDITNDDGTSVAGQGDATASRAPEAPEITRAAQEAVKNIEPGVSAPKSLPPITNTTIKVGIAYSEDPGAANAAAGFAGIGQVDQKRAWDTMIKEVNKSAPFGRKLVPVYYSYTTDDVTSKGAERLFQEMCARWTQDNKVFVAWAAGDETLQSCMTKAKTPQIGGGDGWSKTFKDFPYLVSPADAAMDRMAAFQVDNLHKQGYFSSFKKNDAVHSPCGTATPCTGKAKVGLIRYDEPVYKAAAAAMKKQLAAHGLSLCSGCEFEVAYSSDNIPAQLDDSGEVQTAIQSFKAKGVTHVMFLGTQAGGRITLFFVDGAEKQNYRPKLGLNPNDLATLVRNLLGPSTYPQFKESVIVSYNPGDFEEHLAAYDKCQKIFENAGETFGGDDKAGNKAAQIAVYCDAAWYFGAALQAAGRDLDLGAWMRGVAEMVPVPSAGTYKMKTTATRHDGVGAIKAGKWADSCNCWKPATGVVLV